MEGQCDYRTLYAYRLLQVAWKDQKGLYLAGSPYTV